MTLERQNILDLLYLIGCALKEEAPDPGRTGKMQLEAVFTLSVQHNLGAIAWAGLGEENYLCNPALREKWQSYSDSVLHRTILMDAAREEILAHFEKAGIWYMPLKGSILQNDYPGYGLREMSDNDILIDPTRRDEVETIMVGLGYQAKRYGRAAQDDYYKPPVCSFEMHPCPVDETDGKVIFEYYQDVRQKLLPDGEHVFGLKFTHEDFYIFLCVHAYGHYSGGGTGLRCLADSYVFLKKYGAGLDWDYIARDLTTMGILEYEKNLRQLSETIFDAPERLTEEDWEELFFLTSCGTYGTKENVAKNRMHQMQNGQGKITWKTKLRYLVRRLWMDPIECEMYFPFVAKHPILKPFLVIFRVVRAIFCKTWLLKSEFKALSAPDIEKPGKEYSDAEAHR